MVFSSLTFLFFFLPLVIAAYYIFPNRLRNLILLLFSLLFYSWGEPKYIWLMIFSSVVDFTHAKIIDKYRGSIISKIALCSSIVTNLSLLCYFKYLGFILESSNSIIGTSFAIPSIILPIGISFYTFQTMSYSIDVYLGNAEVQNNFISFAAYVSLFPQLVAGPIVRYKDVAYEIDNRKHNLNNLYEGISLFVIGLGKKVIFANSMGLIWTYVKTMDTSNISLLTAWLGITAFSLQIYFDFSGYSEMAIGLGKMFGFNFCDNFNYPYISKSITEFWRRWHMSLGQWFRDYVYIPLGGNKCSTKRWLFNIFIVWMVTGLWHGAGVNFILWGIYFGLILIIEKIFLSKHLKKAPKFLQHIYALVLIVNGWVLFELENFNAIVGYFKSMYINPILIDNTFIYLLSQNLILLIIAVLASTPIFKRLFENSVFKCIILLVSFIISVAFLVDASFNPFLYFRF